MQQLLVLLCLLCCVFHTHCVASKRALYILDTANARYLECSLPGLKRYAAAYGLAFHKLDGPALRQRARRRRFLAERHGLELSEFDSLTVNDGHFGKLQVFADALERGYEEIAYVDIDLLINEKTDVPNIFEHAALPLDEPTIALYGQGAPKDNIFDAILKINPRLTKQAGVQRDKVNYWNTGVMVLNRLAMQTLKPLVETLYVEYLRNHTVASLPFFDQGFTNAILWDRELGVRVRALSFAWNTSHSKYFYHHGNKFWLSEPKSMRIGSNKEFVPYLYHFMGCAGRKTTLEHGIDCKYKRMQEFAWDEFEIKC